MKTRIQLLLACFLISTAIIAQENVGIGTTNPDPSAKLEILSTDQGLLIPRMNTTQMKTISNPATGLLVFNTEENALFAFDGVKWQILANLPNGNYNDFLRLDENQMPVWKPLLDRSLLPEAGLTLLSGLPIGNEPTKLVVQNERAYVIDKGSDNLKVIDISNRSNPNLLGSIALGPYPEGLAVAGNYAFVTDRDSNDLKVIDLSNPDSLVVIDSLEVGDFTLELETRGHHLFAIDRTAGTLSVFDFSDIHNVQKVYESGGIFSNALELKRSGHYLYVSNSGRLAILDISNPLAPQLLSNTILGNSSDRISEVINNKIVITSYNPDQVR